MSIGQIIVTIISLLLAAGAIAVGIHRKHVPKRILKSVTTSLVFVFSAVLFTNFLHGIGAFTSDKATMILTPILCVIFAIVTYLTIFFVKDEEKQRKIFFSIAAFVFIAAYTKYTFDLYSRTGAYPSHLCRQISCAFPLIYFWKPGNFRKYVLPYFVYAGIMGSIFTLYAPDNILTSGETILQWGVLDTVLTHVTMLVVPILILSTREVKPSLHHLWQFLVFFGISTLFAYFCNYMDFIHSGRTQWGTGMYLSGQVIDGVDWITWWLFGIVVIVLVYILILSFNVGTIYRFFKNRKHPEASDKTPAKSVSKQKQKS